MSAYGTLGCPHTYAIGIVGGDKDSTKSNPCDFYTIIPPMTLQDAIQEITWDRRLNDTSQATVTLSTSKANPDCCSALQTIEPGMHELVIYRDSALVWQGPITATDRSSDGMVIEAADVSAYLARTMNTTDTGMKKDQGRYLSDVAHDLIFDNLSSAFSCPKDFPCILPHISILRVNVTWKIARKSKWNAYVLDILQELAKLGFDWTVVGRTIVIREPKTTADRPQAVLQSDDLSGQISIVKSWDDLATRVFATNSSDNEAGITVYEPSTLPRCSPYVRVDLLISADPRVKDDTGTDAEQQAAIAAYLRDVAKQALKGRYPIPASFRVTDGAALNPSAPVTIRQLVPGERIDVIFTDQCRQHAQAMRLIRLNVTWNREGEKVGVSLGPLAQPDTTPAQPAPLEAAV